VKFYIFDANAIQSVPIKNWSKDELLHEYCKIYEWLTHRSFKPLLHKLDNKTSKDAKAFVATEQTCIQSIPQTSIAQTLLNMPYGHGRITFLPAWQDYQIHSLLPTGVALQQTSMPHSTCYVHVIKILSSWHTKCSRALSLLMQHPWLP
jgi:hypothetical protein